MELQVAWHLRTFVGANRKLAREHMKSQGALLLSSGGAKFVSMFDFAMSPSQPQTYSVDADESKNRWLLNS